MPSAIGLVSSAQVGSTGKTALLGFMHCSDQRTVMWEIMVDLKSVLQENPLSQGPATLLHIHHMSIHCSRCGVQQ